MDLMTVSAKEEPSYMIMITIDSEDGNLCETQAPSSPETR